jgi:hypothetical protein
MSTRGQIAEGRRRDGRITAGSQIILRRPDTRIHPVVEGIVIATRQVRQDIELHVRRLRQRELDLHLAGRGIRRCSKVLVGAVIRPLDGLTTRGRRIAHPYKGRELGLTDQAFEFHGQAGTKTARTAA